MNPVNLNEYEALPAAAEHDEVHLELLPAVGHYELIVPDSMAWSAVRHAVFTLLHGAQG